LGGWLHDWLAAVCLFEVPSDQGSSGESQMKIIENQTFEYMKERRALVCRKCENATRLATSKVGETN